MQKEPQGRHDSLGSRRVFFLCLIFLRYHGIFLFLIFLCLIFLFATYPNKVMVFSCA
jgi:hypothetical protein